MWVERKHIMMQNIWQNRQIHLTRYTNTFDKIYKYSWQDIQIHLTIYTNTFDNIYIYLTRYTNTSKDIFDCKCARRSSAFDEQLSKETSDTYEAQLSGWRIEFRSVVWDVMTCQNDHRAWHHHSMHPLWSDSVALSSYPYTTIVRSISPILFSN